ncbi:DEAD/DEAH box helicase [Rhizobium ruizarguesonis]|uniref:DEAD/DEAH box helicase n=1 Tax=Rhizobium ruizarguesonis TaxID=2081791 RepID=UPI0013DF4439|nr:DEAD/DEAH box helicase [Rhizobium ruizarguesonis]NEJ95412.1 DEAD/DEAH box helicase [Rhizobium ruizarguesonis]
MADGDPMPLDDTIGPFETVDRLRGRAVEAVIAQAALRHEGLADEIRRGLTSRRVSEGALVREPVIESAAPFVSSDVTFGGLAGNVLHPKVVESLSRGPEGRNYRFAPDMVPYKHQLESWKVLGKAEPQSVLVSSGTGSGKTECFMIPLLNDLAIESEAKGRLSGVRAIALYPLNALIASQQERLHAWTQPFGGDIRFGLYNGLMDEDDKETNERRIPNQVLCRRTLRTDPPPILVTNVTMLEYMTIRRVDRPILQKSDGKLRWIVIDEAHSYVGSAAAEIALLIRRVLLAFNVRAKDVRFVATSATIGSGQDVTLELRKFLKDISGAPSERVHLIEGKRTKVLMPTATNTQPIRNADLGSKESLSASPPVKRFVERVQKLPVTLEEARASFADEEAKAEDILEAIAGRFGTEPILPLRLHSFLRTIPGVWSCLNAACTGQRPRDWSFGALAFEPVDQCPHCKSPVFEVVSCTDCGEPYLDTLEIDDKLVQTRRFKSDDEFADASDNEGIEDEDDASEGDDEADEASEVPRLLANRPHEGLRPINVVPSDGRVLDRQSGDAVRIFASNWRDTDNCKCCGAGPTRTRPLVLRSLRFGAPFLIGNATPIMVEGTPTTPVEEGRRNPPAEGRQLLCFTDSRQGTARFAAAIQTNSERGFVRGFIYHLIQKSLRPEPVDQALLSQKQTELTALEAAVANVPALAGILVEKRKELADLTKGSDAGVLWQKVRDALANEPTVFAWIRQVWGRRDKRFDNSESELANFLLLRELARRPKRANSLETLGLARLRFDAIDKLSPISVPPTLATRGRSLEDWQGFLYTLVDLTARGYFAVEVSSFDLDWLVPNRRNRSLVPPGRPVSGKEEHAWPMASGRRGPKSNAVRLLELGLDLSAQDADAREEINSVLSEAWRILEPMFRTVSARYALNFSHARVAPVTDAWLCPVTRRFLPVLALGLTPYGHQVGSTFAMHPPTPYIFPRLPLSFPAGPTDLRELSDWLENDSRVAEFRQRGLWGNLHDRSALLSPYLRAAEHSAQQPAPRLRRFEDEFKRGEINVMNCSTTMEMGVDIGSVTAVMMTNVPPSIANYRQRVGRAGRRRQGIASALTFTRDMPLEREAFRSPEIYLQRSIRAPEVKLDSARIVQRHVNAFLLSKWFAETGGQLNKIKAGEFFGCGVGVDDGRFSTIPADDCMVWLRASSGAHASDVIRLVEDTALAGRTDLAERAVQQLTLVLGAFVAEWQALQDQAKDMDRDAARKSIGFQLQRLCKENLLKELSVRAYLPGHGFPTSVVPFVNKDKPDSDEPIDSETDAADGRYHSWPSRNLDIAIRDYAPGSEVVVDGLVYRSAGVTLNWTRPASADAARDIQNIKNFWQCRSCGAADVARIVPHECPDCSLSLEPPRRYLEPSGFTVDLRKGPHADTDRVVFVEPEPERVVAKQSPWRPLPGRIAGRMRNSFDGLVFYASAGARRLGYCVCLDCGRAEAVQEVGQQALRDHGPLRYTRAGPDGHCPGNSKGFSILNEIDLGHDIVTDVAELQPERLTRPGAAWALLSALREALAQSLGIEAREMGIAVEDRFDDAGEATKSLFLYDRNAGGAGFAPRLVDNLPTLLGRTRIILDCQVPGCVKGCSSCIMAADLYKQQNIVNRRPALEIINRWIDLI